MIRRNKVEIPKSHNLKTLPIYFEAAAKGVKTFEIRRNDRNFKVGEQISLLEHDGLVYTGREIRGEITYITDYEQKEGYVVFGFRKWSVAKERVNSYGH